MTTQELLSASPDPAAGTQRIGPPRPAEEPQPPSDPTDDVRPFAPSAALAAPSRFPEVPGYHVLREVGRGGSWLPPALARSLAFAAPALATSPLAKLNPREIEILRLLGAGKSLTEIAWQIRVSYKTIANTSSIMRQKLGLRSSAELVQLAIESRLI